MSRLIATITGWLLDFLLGDPAWLPHPVVGFGKLIAVGEKWLNKGRHRRLKGALMAIFLVAATFVATAALLQALCLL
jgi:adenosylcobinamide-phosphate synthase